MNIHEYQAKEIFQKYSVPTPRGYVAHSVEEAVANAQKLGGSIWVVKAQIHAGGRGLGGGVKLARSLEEVKTLSSEILGMTLVTHQTGPEGKLVQKIYIEEGVDIAEELYLGVVLDRAQEMPVIMASLEGGMEIENVAHDSPEKIIKVVVDRVQIKICTKTDTDSLSRLNSSFSLALNHSSSSSYINLLL